MTTMSGFSRLTSLNFAFLFGLFFVSINVEAGRDGVVAKLQLSQLGDFYIGASYDPLSWKGRWIELGDAKGVPKNLSGEIYSFYKGKDNTDKIDKVKINGMLRWGNLVVVKLENTYSEDAMLPSATWYLAYSCNKSRCARVDPDKKRMGVIRTVMYLYDKNSASEISVASYKEHKVNVDGSDEFPLSLYFNIKKLNRGFELGSAIGDGKYSVLGDFYSNLKTMDIESAIRYATNMMGYESTHLFYLYKKTSGARAESPIHEYLEEIKGWKDIELIVSIADGEKDHVIFRASDDEGKGAYQVVSLVSRDGKLAFAMDSHANRVHTLLLNTELIDKLVKN